MLKALAERRDRDDEGFTLIELMVVVLIIAILLAIAIPTFLGARERAQERAAQSDIRNALTAEKVYFTDTELFTENGTGTPITSIEPSLTYVVGAGTKTEVGLKASADGTAICIGKQSKSEKLFSIIEVSTGPGAGTWYAKVNCSATAPVNASSTAATGPGGTYVKTGF